MLAASVLMIHNTGRGSQNNETKLTGGQQVVNPVLQVGQLDVEAGRNNSTLVQTAIEVNNNLTRAVVIDNFELVNIS